MVRKPLPEKLHGHNLFADITASVLTLPVTYQVIITCNDCNIPMRCIANIERTPTQNKADIFLCDQCHNSISIEHIQEI